MRKYLNWLLGKPLSHEVRCLIDAIDSDEVEWNGVQFIGIDVIVYNGVRVAAYTVNSCSGYTVDIGFCSNCLPHHEAKAVYKALVRHNKRRRKRVEAQVEVHNREEVHKALGFHNK
ncbi:hypothetical protein M1Y69_003626 [Salmonella enterica]|nr:hypothetical protein Mooltan_171 [Salmonella phage Mooltan]EJD3358142.1 hypothetical protein [Salmonella enterica]QEA10287.1 hypothetical protein CPT_Matapan_176 [Salmonella phage Matapan]